MNETDKPLWIPSEKRISAAQITDFRAWLYRTRGLSFANYEELWRWSVDDIEQFWQAILEYFPVITHSPYRQVLEARVMPGAKWFDGATLNYAEHLLAGARQPDALTRPALVFESELCPRTEYTWSELAGLAGALTKTLTTLGIHAGDRVVSFLPNIPAAVVSLLATSSIGAIWSSCSPDMGATSVLDRFRQIAPRVLIAVDGYRYNGKDHDRLAVVRELVEQLPTVECVILVAYLNPAVRLDLTGLSTGETAASAGASTPPRQVRLLSYSDVTATPAPPNFVALPFAHPLWIVYSSGTTGMPKPIVHSHGGSVIENFKGNGLHLDLRRDDRFFWFSSTSWIMWNFQVSTLAMGLTVFLFDGNPAYPDLTTLFRLAERERLTFFGISPAFIGLCMKAGLKPNQQFDLSSIRTVGATGSPLTVDGYRWVYEAINADLMLASISGGTDPGTSFVGACPILSIYAGEMQARGLGVATYAFNDAGQAVYDEVGELVCALPMPSMPLYFWNDVDGKRYFESYFEQYPGIWRHGDWLKLIQRKESVTSVIYGRSDSTINRHGIRMGTSELYRVVEEFAEVLDSLVVDLEYLGRESYMALFVVLRDGNPEVPVALKKALLDALRTRLSARHVPNEIYAIAEVPRTISGKKMEVPVKKILLGYPVEKSANRDSMANPGSLDWFIKFGQQLNSSSSPTTQK
jgi:acetoacetyl-CoA synthetase